MGRSGKRFTSMDENESRRARFITTDVKPHTRLRDNWAQTITELSTIADTVSKQKLTKIITIFSDARKRRFARRRNKGGNINRGFTDEELTVFFQVIRNPRHYLFFQYQAKLGLRVGEACSIRVSDISYSNRTLRIDTEKSRKIDYLRIPQVLFEETLRYINRYAITDRLFPYAPETMRAVFRRYCIRAGLHEVYAHSTDGNRLHRLSTHSLRHYAITRFYALTQDIVKTQKFARHTKLETTQRYIHIRMDEVNEAIDFMEKPIKMFNWDKY